jgi:hypothetical protein
MFDACFEHVRPALAIAGNGPPLRRLRNYIARATEFLCSEDGKVMARLVTGIHEDNNLQQLFLDRYVLPGVEFNEALSRKRSRQGK